MRTLFCLLALFLAVGTAPAGERVVLRARSFGGRTAVRSFSSVRVRSFGAGFHSFGFAGHGYGTVGLGASYGFRAFAGDPCYGAPVSEVVELKTTTQPVRQTTTTETTTTTTTTESTGVLKSSVRRFVR